MAGSLAGYLIGAWGGRPLLDRFGRYVHIYPDDLDRADAWFARYGSWAVFFARMVPLLRALINYPAGSRACRSAASCCSARWARCRGTRR